MNCEVSEEKDRDKQLDKKRDFIQNGYMWNYVAKVQLLHRGDWDGFSITRVKMEKTNLKQQIEQIRKILANNYCITKLFKHLVNAIYQIKHVNFLPTLT